VSDKQVAVVDAVLSFSTAESDERFAPCVIRIAHAGLNRNKSVISKEVFERSAKSAYGCPIVCNYDVCADTIGGHDKAIIRTDDGARLINMTHPVGYVPEGARYWWETIEENGEEKEYLCVEAVLWKREAAYRHIEECGSVAQSMEISIRINDFVKDGEFFIVNAFTFVAFCLLERDEPAMRSACVKLFSCSAFVEQFSLMVEEFHQQKIGERRNEMPDETKPEVTPPGEAAPQEFSLDASALQCELSKRVAAFEAHPEYPDWPRFCVVDYDPAAQEVFAYDYVDGCACGFKYTVSGDDIAVARDTYAKKKSKYVDWVTCGEAPRFASLFEEFAENRRRVAELEAENRELTAYRANAEAAERDRAVQALCTEFSDLADEAAFKELLANSELPVDALTEKAYALRGRLAAKPQQEFSAPVAGPQGLHLDSHAAGSGSEHHPYGSAAKYFPAKKD